MKDIKSIINLSTEYLEKHQIESAKVKAEWIISHFLKLKRLDLYLQFDRPLNEEELSHIRAALKRCAAHEPVQYICGTSNFYGLEMQVGPGVLIPRPETEQLVDLVLQNCQDGDLILDLCTGSACIPLAIADNKNVSITATELEDKAYSYAENNLRQWPDAKIELLQGDLFCEIAKEKQFDLICSNPPYVAQSEVAQMGKDVLKHEPHSALFAEDEGMIIIERIARLAKAYLKANAPLLLEIGCHQGERCLKLFQKLNYASVEIIKDYSGRDRFLSARNNNENSHIR